MAATVPNCAMVRTRARAKADGQRTPEASSSKRHGQGIRQRLSRARARARAKAKGQKTPEASPGKRHG